MNTAALKKLNELIIIETDIFSDERGTFLESHQQMKYEAGGVAASFVQDNLVYSNGSVLRGLHYQLGRSQAKLIYVVQGAIFDVAVDVRKGSPTFGVWESVTLSAENHRQLFIPEGFAHGYCVLSETAAVVYKCSDYYAPAEERGICWDDPSIAVDWPVSEPVISERDRNLPYLESIPAAELPEYSG